MRLLAKSRSRDWEARLLAKVVGASERDDYGCRFGGLPTGLEGQVVRRCLPSGARSAPLGMQAAHDGRGPQPEPRVADASWELESTSDNLRL